MLLSGLCLKWDCIYYSGGTTYRSTCKRVHVHLHQFRIAGVIYGSILYIKDLKKLLAYSISPRWVNCSRDYTLTIDGLRGAVLQMIAHGFVVVGLFSSLTSF
jgi:NADH-quinone oxidoreductase subunit M